MLVSKKKIGLLTGSSLKFFGGGERFIIEFANELILMGYNVTILTQKSWDIENKTIAEIETGSAAKIIWYRIIKPKVGIPFPLFNAKTLNELKKMDCIYCVDESLFLNVAMNFISKVRKIDFVYGMHTPSSFLFGNELAATSAKKILWEFYKIPLRYFFKHFVKKIHVINSSQKKGLMKINYRGKIFMVPNFLFENKAIIIKKEDKFIVLFSALMNKQIKGIDLLEHIIALTLDREKEIKFVLTGSLGDSYDVISALTNKYPENVVYRGFVSDLDLSELRSLSSLNISTSRIEAFPLSILEAQNAGLPCISFKIAGPIDMITNSEQGMLIAPFDINVFSDAILKYFYEWKESKESYNNNRKRIKDIVEARYSKEIIIPKLLEMFD